MRSLGLIVIIVAGLGAVSARAEPLAVREGVWELTETDGKDSSIRTVCLTPDTPDGGLLLAKPLGPDCGRNVSVATQTERIEMFLCPEGSPSTGKVTIDVVTPTKIYGSFLLDGRTTTFSAKWLGNKCGNG